jgi:ubiquinone/menaquinone biosynthesis C-methylase UbiE
MAIIEQEEAISDIDNARKYAQRHKKYAGLMYRSVLKDIKANRISGSCLEIGAGPGLLAVMVARENTEVNITAVDLSPGMAMVANEHISKNGLENRIRYLVGDVSDEKMLQKLGKFNFVYSTFSMHDWKAPESSLRNLWNVVEDNGMLYIYDFRRIGWLCSLPFRGREVESMRASYSPNEIREIFGKISITDCGITTHFPFLFQSITAHKGLT